MVYVHIDNDSITTGNTQPESNFEYKLSQPINGVVQTNFKYARLPIMPTVITGWNDILYFNSANDGSGATLLSITIPQGYYTPDELVAELNTLMTATATTNTFNSTYDPNSGKMTLISSANSRLVASQNAVGNRANKLVGHNGVVGTLATSTVLTFEMDLASVKYFSVILELEGYKNPEIINNLNPFCFVVPNLTDNLSGVVAYVEENFSQVNYVSKVNVSKMRVKTYLENDLTNDLNFLDGRQFQYMFELIQSNKYAYVGLSRKG